MGEIGGKIAGSGYTIVDFAMIGLSKRTTEAILAKTAVGNGTLKSAILKIGLGWGISFYGSKFLGNSGVVGKLPDWVAGGLVVDGVEDAWVALLGTGNPIDALTGRAESAQAGLVEV